MSSFHEKVVVSILFAIALTVADWYSAVDNSGEDEQRQGLGC